jgi:hypothetical protein
MTSFTKRSGTFFTLRHHVREDDGCARTTGTVCSGGEPAGEAVLCLVRGVRDIAPPRMLWYQRDQPWGRGGIASRRRQLSPRRTGAEREPRVMGMRQRYADWGARKLLAREGVELTAAPSIAFGCGGSWCAMGMGRRRRWSAWSGLRRMSGGRWTLRVRTEAGSGRAAVGA